MNTNAAKAYAEKRALIAEALEVLKFKLDKHAEFAAKDPGNWGYVGDLANVLAKLDELAESI